MVSARPFASLGEGVFLLADEMFPLYVVRGERNFLIDCSITAKARAIEEQLRALLREGKIDTALLTHSHYDHTGACAYLQGRFGFDVLCSLRTKQILENPKSVEFMRGLNEEFKEIVHDSLDIVFSAPDRIRAGGEGDVIRVSGQREFRVYETPGHTRCSLSFLLAPDGILFIGDAAGVLERSGRIKPLFLSSYVQYESSLQKLASLEASTVALPHNRFIRGAEKVRNFFADSLQETRRLKEELIVALRETSDVDAIAKNILAREFSSPAIMGPRKAFMINLLAMIKAVQREFAAGRS